MVTYTKDFVIVPKESIYWIYLSQYKPIAKGVLDSLEFRVKGKYLEYANADYFNFLNKVAPTAVMNTSTPRILVDGNEVFFQSANFNGANGGIGCTSSKTSDTDILRFQLRFQDKQELVNLYEEFEVSGFLDDFNISMNTSAFYTKALFTR